ncbi:hypothetical protein PBI_AN9_86 [Mycobacterium phage AN9]|nr:hypothetical protein PBI_VC3_85 [Mycobacterium phage VC3]QJD52548.1 hypothetical protein PBI_ANI8_86 [Mycobacterium phage ANI8]QJD52640.1 hypothetical protein PBI_AN9_86 [Mycobacterium phage AN9]BBC43640.1 hypothetical protein [Mycobacterium phage C3]
MTREEIRARRAEIDRKEALNPFPAANIRPRRPFTPYLHQRPR